MNNPLGGLFNALDALTRHGDDPKVSEPTLALLRRASGAGKTTLMVKLLAELRRRGLSVSIIKHAHHGFDLDQPGKDSFRHREAGAKEVMLAADARWALMHEIGDERQPPLEDLFQRMAPVDLVLIEGFHRRHHPALEVYRPSGCKRCIATADMPQAEANRLGVEIALEKFTDYADIADYGIAATPGVVVDRKVVHAGGLPKPKDMAKWLAA